MVEKAGDHHQVGALELGRGHQRSGHFAEGDIAGDQRALHQGAFKIKHFNIETVLFKQLAFLGDPQDGHCHRRRAVADAQFVSGENGICANDSDKDEKSFYGAGNHFHFD